MRGFMERFCNFGVYVVKKYIHDEMSVYGAQASFFTILAAFPFLMLLLAFIELVPLVHESDLMRVLTELLPDHFDPLIVTVLESLRSSSPGAILSASAVAALWSSSKGMLSIERGLNRAYHVQVQRNYFVRRIICSGYTFLFALMCVISLVFRFSAFLILLFLITAFYVVLPYQKQKILSQLPGALFSTVGWGIFSAAFSFYFQHIGQFSAGYGGLTAVIFLMLWLYFCICILFLGAEVNSVLAAESPFHQP